MAEMEIPPGLSRTIADELAWATRSLEEVGIDTARLDAELLLAHALGTDRAGLVIRAGETITSDARTRYLALMGRRASHEPVAYITGKQAFRHLDLAVDPRVLIPRPETELLVEVGLELPEGGRVVDVGTGSGAVALALKQERPDLELSGLDISVGALDLARHNASRLRLEVRFAEADLLDDGDYSAVLANLPYVRADEVLPPGVLHYEPGRALFGGADGLELIRRLLDQVRVRPRITHVALEIGAEQGPATAELVAAAGFAHPEIRRDLAGHDRVVVGRR
ncbi:MAG TPA: peptide chain release factor N(5)-glutamine methyltransferase [Solirubrobacteraceae bacterium]|nr:peptide chain release factor N(5)-glutamine methyltransferase [Solirubrobacteraceae bacterium]